jgi:hypothetical protein
MINVPAGLPSNARALQRERRRGLSPHDHQRSPHEQFGVVPSLSPQGQQSICGAVTIALCVSGRESLSQSRYRWKFRPELSFKILRGILVGKTTIVYGLE